MSYDHRLGIFTIEFSLKALRSCRGILTSHFTFRYRQNRMLSVQRKTIVDTYLQERRNIVEEAKKALKSFRESRQEERERLYHLQQLQEMRQVRNRSS